MKKLMMVIFIILVLTLSIGHAEIDTSARSLIEQMDDNTLIEFRDMINQTLIDRGVEIDAEFSQGVYVVGKNLKAGSYRLTFSMAKYGTIVDVYDSEEDYANHKRSYFVTIIGEEDSAISLDLVDGNVLYIEDYNGSTKIRITTTKPSWAP